MLAGYDRPVRDAVPAVRAVPPAISIFEMRELAREVRGSERRALRPDGRASRRRRVAGGGGGAQARPGGAAREAYSPFPVEGVAEALGFGKRTCVPLLALRGGVAVAASADIFMQ
jgi:hypothetical protein